MQRQETSQFDLGYGPLKKGEYRLLELKASPSENAEIVCELHIFNESTKYEAVSYLRSFDEGVPIAMLTSGKRRSSKTVMPNLHAALKHLRLADRSRFLWVNALCIDHSNVNERSGHVHVLHKIFHRASKVCLWLGETDGSISGDTSTALSFADELLAPKFFEAAAHDVKAVRNWKALLDLISHPLFERRWVAQEVAVAGQATLHYGRSTMNWSDFADVVTMFEHVEKRNHAISNLFKVSTVFEYHPDIIGDVQALSASRFINLTSNIFKSKTESDASNKSEIAKSLLSLEDLVFQLASFKGWDPRDVIYACVSVSQESQDTGFPTWERPPKPHPTLAKAAKLLPKRPPTFVKAANKFLRLRQRKVSHAAIISLVIMFPSTHTMFISYVMSLRHSETSLMSL